MVHLVSPGSDHCPLLVSLDREVRVPNSRKCKQYEICWERDEALPEVIAEAWLGATHSADLAGDRCAWGAETSHGFFFEGSQVMDRMHAWGGRKFGNVGQSV